MSETIETAGGIVLIRPVKPAEVAAFRALRLEALQQAPEAFGADYQQNLEKPFKAWQEQVEGSQGQADSLVVVAESTGRLVGMTGILRSASPKSRHSAMIWGVYVQPAWRGLHLAKKMLSACCSWAKQQGIEILRLGVVTANISAIRLYERFGFQAYGVEPKSFYVNGKYYDLMRMFMEL